MILQWHIESQEAQKVSTNTGRLSDDQYDRLETRRAKLRAKGINVI